MEIGRVGVWTRTDGLQIGESAEFARSVEALGYGALWIPDAFGRDPFAHATWLFSQTSSLVIATGVVNIHLREAQATACAQRALHDQSGGRFLLGLGVSHGTVIESMFKNVEAKYYGFLTLIFFPFYKSPENSKLFRFISGIDRMILKTKYLRFLAWSVLVKAEKN